MRERKARLSLKDKICLLDWFRDNMEMSGIHPIRDLVAIVRNSTNVPVNQAQLRYFLREVDFEAKSLRNPKGSSSSESKINRNRKLREIAKALLELGEALGHEYSNEDVLIAIKSQKKLPTGKQGVSDSSLRDEPVQEIEEDDDEWNEGWDDDLDDLDDLE